MLKLNKGLSDHGGNQTRGQANFSASPVWMAGCIWDIYDAHSRVTSQTSYSPEYITPTNLVLRVCMFAGYVVQLYIIRKQAYSGNVTKNKRTVYCLSSLCIHSGIFTQLQSVGSHISGAHLNFPPFYSPSRTWSFGKFQTFFENHSVTRSIIPNNRRRTERKEQWAILYYIVFNSKTICRLQLKKKYYKSFWQSQNLFSTKPQNIVFRDMVWKLSKLQSGYNELGFYVERPWAVYLTPCTSFVLGAF